MTATPTRPRGHCPDALAEEVYRRTIAGVRKRIGHQHVHSQAAADAVGEAFIRWLGTPADKTLRLAVEHAHWLIANSIGHLLNTNPNKRRTARAVRSLASWGSVDSEGDAASSEARYQRKHEAILRKFYNVSEPADYEDNLLGALDATAAKVRGVPSVPTTTWRTALDALFTRGWTRAQIAAAVGVSYQSVRAWAAGDIVPHYDRRAEVIALAATNGPQPPPITAEQASRAPRRSAPRAPADFQLQRNPRPRPANPAADQVLAMMRDMISRGDRQIDIARTLGVSESCVCSWRSGKYKPGSAQSAKVLAWAQNTAQRPSVDLLQEPVAVA